MRTRDDNNHKRHNGKCNNGDSDANANGNSRILGDNRGRIWRASWRESKQSACSNRRIVDCIWIELLQLDGGCEKQHLSVARRIWSLRGPESDVRRIGQVIQVLQSIGQTERQKEPENYEELVKAPQSQNKEEKRKNKSAFGSGEVGYARLPLKLM